ncbi:hypothetical protein F5884DRAFT_282104 [Xylogone sp. PMI_703]|nr:hypothetical protein F5884DRAFT_282104 [Xylogone sp. PMI_703]
MPWQALPRIAFAVATYPFTASFPEDLPLELGDELYIIEQGGKDGQWLRGYLVAPPSLLAGLTSVKGQTLEARVFSGIFPRSCVEIREVLGEVEEDVQTALAVQIDSGEVNGLVNGARATPSPSPISPSVPRPLQIKKVNHIARVSQNLKSGKLPNGTSNGSPRSLSVMATRVPGAPRPPAPVPMLKIGDETPTSESEPLVDEIASCLREWHSTNLHELLLSRRYSLLDKMAGLVRTLDMSRRQFLNNVLTTHELQLLREKTVWDLVRGNKLFNGEVIVRDPAERGRIMTGEDSAVEITKLQSIMSLLDEKPHPAVENTTCLYHLLVDVKAFVGASTESTTLDFFLASKAPGSSAKPLSESYVVEVPAGGTITSIAKTAPMRTLFTDLASADIGELPAADNELYLIVKVRSSHQVVATKPGSRSGNVIREEEPVTRSGEKDKPPSSGGLGKAGRRSLMWGHKAQRAAFSRNAPPTSKLGSVSEVPNSRAESRDEQQPPSTAGSRGQASNGPKPGAISQQVMRTVGIGALKVNSIMKQNEEVEQLMTIWSPSVRMDEKAEHGEGWEEVIKDLMSCQSGRYERSRRAERLQIHLKPFNSQDVDQLIKETPTMLSGVTKTSKMGFSGAPTKPRSDIYITMDEAVLPRHALLSRASGGAVPLSSSLAGTNLQVTMEVRHATGERIERCIFPSSSSEGISSWESTATERGTGWNQTLRLSISPSDVPRSHLVMILADVPHQPLAICHMPLWDQGAFLRDGQHSLLWYKYDETIYSPDAAGKGGYLNAPWSARGKDDTVREEALTGPLATLQLRSYLCSTRFSQDKVLLGLLGWKEQSKSDVQELIKRLVFVPEIEIVKLLNDVFDAIFGLIVENAGNDEFEDLLFSALVTVLGIVHDRRFNLGPLVDQYTETKFNYPFATPCLIRSLTRLLAKPSDPETSRMLRTTFKVVKHILRFITHGRGQQKAKEAEIGITSTSAFTKQVRSIFKALDGLMRSTAPILVGSQTLAVQHFHTWLPELKGLLTTEEIVHIAIDFMDSCSLVRGKLILYKLILIINYSKLDLFSSPEQRAALSTNTVRWIEPHWGSSGDSTEQWRNQVRLCCSILATQMDVFGPQIPDYMPKIIASYLAIQAAPKQTKNRLSLLFPTTYPFPSKPMSGEVVFDEALIELSAIISVISTTSPGMQLELANVELATLVEDILLVHLNILECHAFPSDWLSVHIYHHKSTMKALEYLAGILLESFLPDPDDAESYNTELWKCFFSALLKLVGSDSLALETFPEQKRRAVWKIAGDVREQGAELLRRTWEAIGWETSPSERQRYGLTKMGGYQVQYVPALVGPIMELCLSVHEGLRHVAVEVLQSMIVSEWTLSEDLSIIQTEMIDCLDNLFKSKPLTESILQKLFINELLDLFEPLAQIPNDPLHAAIKELIATIDEFLDLLVAVYSTDGTGDSSNMIHRLRLMEFLRDMQKEEIFIRYVHQLARLQQEARNPTGAGLALKLHADLYDWDPTTMVPALSEPVFPVQTHFERKERIYFDVIKYFEEGEAWSSALAVYKELEAQYEENVFDFPKLARTQRAVATIYEKISRSEKVVPKYFRVVYKGMGFPTTLRDKEFIFEGTPTERLSAFTDRMQAEHPSAQIVTSGDIDDVEGQFLQITQLSPYRDLDHHVFQRARVPNAVRDYLVSSNPQAFAVTSRRNTSGPVVEHTSEKIIYTTASTFPTILRRSEIISIDRIKLSAIQTALERVIRKTQEISVVEKKLLDGEEEMVSLIIDALNISVNPNSDSSVAKYRELLPNLEAENEDMVEDPEMMQLTPLENALKMALLDHAIMIRRCLTMFVNSNNEQLRQSQLGLGPYFEETFAPELAMLSTPQTSSPVPVNQSWTIPSSVLNQENPRYSIPQPRKHHGSMDRTNADRRSRLSFLKKQSISIPNSKTNGYGRERGQSDAANSNRSPEKDNRKSFFGGPRGRADTQSDMSEVNGDRETESHKDGSLPGRRSSSSQRPDTAVSAGSRVGSVRKRLSILKLGKKTSRPSVLVASVAEE